MKGDRIVEVIDTNHNGIPDSGDTAVTVLGRRIDNVQFSRPIVGIPLHFEGEHAVRARKFAGSHLRYDVRPIAQDSFESLAICLAGSTQDYGKQRVDEARAIGKSISDNKVVTAAITIGGALLMLHPYGRTAMSGVGVAGAGLGTGYMILDRLSGIVRGTAMGKHDLAALLGIAGGAPALKGMNVSELWNFKSVFGGASRFFGGPPMMPQLAGAGANGGSIAVSIEGVAEAGATTAVAGGPVRPAGASPVIMSIMEIIETGGQVDTKSLPKPIAPWEKSDAQKSFENIRAGLEILIESDRKGITAMHGLTKSKVTPQELLEQLKNMERGVKELYQRVGSEEERKAIELALREQLTEMDRLIAENSLEEVQVLLKKAYDGVRVVEKSSTVAITVLKEPPPPFISYRAAIHKEIPKVLENPDNIEYKKFYLETMRRIEEGTFKPNHPNARTNVFEHEKNSGPGYRIYGTMMTDASGEKRTIILHVGPKGTFREQNAAIDAAEKVANRIHGEGLDAIPEIIKGPKGSIPPGKN
jgi:hypothetical protein